MLQLVLFLHLQYSWMNLGNYTAGVEVLLVLLLLLGLHQPACLTVALQIVTYSYITMQAKDKQNNKKYIADT